LKLSQSDPTAEWLADRLRGPETESVVELIALPQIGGERMITILGITPTITSAQIREWQVLLLSDPNREGPTATLLGTPDPLPAHTPLPSAQSLLVNAVKEAPCRRSRVRQKNGAARAWPATGPVSQDGPSTKGTRPVASLNRQTARPAFTP